MELGFGNAYDRIMKLAKREGECLVMRQKARVPQIRIAVGGFQWVEAATRIVWSHAHGIHTIADPDDNVRRTCADKDCVEIAHLTLSPPGVMITAENVIRHRVATREAVKHRRKIPHQAVTAIRRSRSRGESLYDLGARYGHHTVYDIANGFIYRDDDEPTPERGPTGIYRSRSR
jgi:hypothetical protein